jgi:hypothetical protein
MQKYGLSFAGISKPHAVDKIAAIREIHVIKRVFIDSDERIVYVRVLESREIKCD